MADSANYGLLTPVATQVIPQTAGTNAIAGMTAGAGIANTQANTQATQSDMKMKQLTMVNNIAGSVVNMPPDQQPAAYQQALKQAGMIGMDTSALPQQWGDDAKSYTQSAYYNSGIELQRLQAQAQMAIAGSNIDTAQQNVNVQAQRAGVATPYGAPGGPQNAAANLFATNGQGGGVLGGGAQTPAQGQGGGYLNQPVPIRPGMNPQIQTGTNTAPNAINTSGMATPGTAPVTPQGPAALAAQTKEGQDWATSLNASQQNIASYDTTNAAINRMRTDISGALVPTGPITGYAAEHTPSGESLESNAAQVTQQLAKQLAATGVPRFSPGLVNMLEAQVPSNFTRSQVNLAIADKLQAGNQIANQIVPLIKADLNNRGVRSDSVAGPIIAETLEKTQMFDPKTGQVNLDNLNKWQDSYQQALQDKGIVSKTSQAPAVVQDTPQTRQAIQQLYPTASQAQISQMIQLQNQKQQNNNQQSGTSGAAVPPLVLQKSMAAIGQIESNNNYQAIGPTVKGDNALGKYQIMASQVGPWSKEVLGQSITPQQFLQNPQIQDTIAKAKMGQYLSQTNDLRDLPAKWFSGKGYDGNTSSDPSSGDNVPNYTNKFMKAYASF